MEHGSRQWFGNDIGRLIGLAHAVLIRTSQGPFLKQNTSQAPYV